MASAIRTVLRVFGAEVWCFWQPGWGVIDARNGYLRQFYAVAQYARFICPGFTVLSVATLRRSAPWWGLSAARPAAPDGVSAYTRS